MYRRVETILRATRVKNTCARSFTSRVSLDQFTASVNRPTTPSQMQTAQPQTTAKAPITSTHDPAPTQHIYPVPLPPYPHPLPPVEEILDKRSLWRSLLSLFFGCALLAIYLVILQDAIPLGATRDDSVKPVEQTEDNAVKFQDVLGCDDAKKELEDIVTFLRNPSKFEQLGAELPKGVWMEGSPGVGKTMLGKAVANEAGVPFFYATGSSFDEIFVGLGAKRVRKLFREARKKAPCVIFIDEMDAVGGTRTKAYGNRQTINQILSEMDGFKSSEGIVVIGATNLGDRLDSALTRPGRFDRHVRVDAPDEAGRMAIIEHYLKKLKQVDKAVNIRAIAASTPGLTGADLSNIVNGAAIRAIKDKTTIVTHKHLDLAKDEVLLGHENKSRIITEKDRQITALHEGGHALVALLTTQSHLVNKATILSRGHALGQTHFFADEKNPTRQQLLDRTVIALGGRAAEEILNGNAQVTTGASSDIEYATRIVRSAVESSGFGAKTGPVSVSSRISSDEGKEQADEEVMEIINTAFSTCKKLLTQNESKLRLLTSELLKRETLTADEMRDILKLPKQPQKT